MPLDFDIITGLNTSNSEILKQDTELRLANILGVQPGLDSGSTIMPRVPTMISPGNPLKRPNTTPKLSEKGAFDSWIAETSRSDKDFNSGAGVETIQSAKGTERYLDEAYGYNPERDNEDFYAKQQSWMTEIPKAIGVKLPALILSKVGTGLGFLAGLADPNNWNEDFISRAADNGLARTFENLEDNIKNDWLTTFQESADQGKGFFSRAFTDLNFWTEDVTDGVAFLASAFVPGLALSKVGAGAKAAQLLTQLGIASENGVLGNLGLAKLAGYMRNAQSIATGIDKTLITALNTASESMWEAKQVRDTMMDSLKGKINPTTGQLYTDPEMRAKAGQAAQGTFLANAAILSLSNAWETNLLYKALGRETGAIRRIGQSALGQEFATQTATSAVGRALESKGAQYLGRAAAGIGVEGFYEENAQLAVQRIYDGTAKRDNFFSQLLTQTGDALMGNDTEAAMNIGIGGLIGGIGGAAGNFFQNRGQQARDRATVEMLNNSQASWMSFGNIYQTAEDGKTMVLDAKGNPQIDFAKLRGTVENWSKLTDLKVELDNTSDPDLYKIIQKEAFASFVKAHINAGIEGQIQGKLDALTSLTDQQLVSFGFDPQSNQNRMEDIADLKSYAQSLIELNETINNDILYRPRAGESQAEFGARKNYLYTLGSRQLALQNQSNILNNDIEAIRARMANPNINQPTVDQFNYLRQRIESQRALINQVDNYTLDGSDLNIEEERAELASLTSEFNNLRDANRELFNSLVVKKVNKGNEVYQLPGQRDISLEALNRKIKAKAELDNTAASVNREFYSIANTDNGTEYFKNKVNNIVDNLLNQANIEEPPINPDEQSVVPGNKTTVRMKGDVDVELEEGKLYIGQLSKTPVAVGKGATATVFNNDKIKIISINEDGTITLTLNNDAPITLTPEELAEIAPFFKYDNLTALQKFYLANRNNVYKYRVPIKYNKTTKTWDTSIVSGRLSYDKEKNILNLAYKVGDNVRYIEFNPKYVVGQMDIRSLPTEQQLALQEQQAKLDKLREAQYRLFENLINNTDNEIDEQKRLAQDNYNDLQNTQERLNQLTSDLERYREEFAQTDQSRASDRRTKAGRIVRVIKKLEAEIATVENQLERLKQEREDITKRQQALEFMMDEYLNAYDSLIDTNEPITRAELSYLEHREGELVTQDGQGARYTISQIEDMLANTLIEQEATDIQIQNLEGYLKDLREMLDRLQVEFNIANIYDRFPNITDAHNYIKDQLADPDLNQQDRKSLTQALNRMNKYPKYFYDTRFLINEIKDTIDTINRAKRGNGFLKTRITQLSKALEIKQEIEDVRGRMNYLKNVFAGLAKEFEKEKAAVYAREAEKQGKTVIVARTVEDARNAAENEKLFSEFITEPPTGEDISKEDYTIFWDTDKPVMTTGNNPLYKSADSHYPNEQINPQVYTQRFFKFSSQVNLDGSYYIMPITEANDGLYGPKIRFNDETYKDDIKFVVVKKVGNKFVPIDIEGRPLESPTNDTIVYSSFYGHPDLLTGSDQVKIAWAKNTFALKNNLTDAEILTKINEFLAFRNRVKELTREKGNQYIQITSKSNGYQNRVPKDTVTGLPQQLSIEGRLAPKNPNWADVDLIVSTLGGVSGQTNIKLKPGRLAIRKNGNVYQVYNRLLSDQEKARIKRLLTKLVYSFGKKQEYEQLVDLQAVMTQEEIDSFTKDINTANTITQYLSSIIYWDRPVAGKTRTSHQFQIDRGYLRRGSGSEEVSVPFTSQGLEKLDLLLDGVYHQVANRLVNNNNLYNILDIDPDTNNLTFTTVDNYKTYLFSGNDPIIYTNVVEDNPTDYSLPQMKNSYVTFGTLEDRAKVIERHSKNVILTDAFRTASNGEYTIEFSNPKTGVALSVEFTKNGANLTKTKVTLVSGQVEEDRLQKNADNLLAIVQDIGNPDAEYADASGNPISALQRIEVFRATGVTFNVNRVELIEKTYEETPIQPAPRVEALVTPPPSTPIVPDTSDALVRDKEGNPIFPEGEQGQQTQGTTPTVTESSQAESLVPSVDDLKNKFSSFDTEEDDEQVDDEYDNFRIAIQEESDYIKENVEETKEWFKNNLPQFALTFTDYLIEGKAWGQFKQGAIYIYNNAEQGTGFHEAFEAVWASLLSSEQREGLINEFKKRPNYKTLLAQTANTWKGLSENQLIKETLAEEFRTYVLSDGKTGAIVGQGKRNSFFRRLWNFIKSLLGFNEDQNYTIDELFQKINKAGFSNAPILNYDAAVVNFKRVPGVSQEVTSMAIEGITANFFIKLFAKQENTDSLFSKQSNFKLLNDILTEVRSQLANTWELDIYKKAATEAGVFTTKPANDDEVKLMLNNLTPADVAKVQSKLQEFESTNKYNYKDKLTILKQFKNSVLPIFYDYLRQYGFVIKQNTVDEEDTEDTNQEEIRDSVNYNDPLGIRDTITIDTRNTANTTVRLLIASLTDSKYNKVGQIIYNKNGLGLPRLVDYDKTINTLFNELQGIIPTFNNSKKQEILDMMFNKLEDKFMVDGLYKPGFTWIYELKRKLKYVDKTTGQKIPIGNLKEEDMRLRVAFIKSFSKSKNNPLKLILTDNNNIYSVDPISSSNVYRIREAWNNNAKASTQKSNEFLKVENNTIMFNTTSPTFSSLLRSNAILDKIGMLRGLGITFSIPDVELAQKYNKTFGDATLRISELILRGEITTFDDLFSKQNVNGPINALLAIELENNADNLSLQYRNPSGENEYSIVNSSNITNLLNSLRHVNTLQDFVRTNPQFGEVSGDNIILKPYLQGSEVFKLGGRFFDINGKKKRDITYNLISGIAQATEQDGDVTSRLKRADKVLQDLFHMVNGTYYTIINSDKSSEFGLNFGEFVDMFNFTVNSEIYNSKVRDIYSKHLKDEVVSLVMLSRGVGADIQYYATNQKYTEGNNKGKWALSHFRDIIKSDVSINKLQQAIASAGGGNIAAVDTFVNDSTVQLEIENYLKDFILRHQEELIRLGIVERLPDGTYSSKALANEQMKNLTGGNLNPKSFSKAQFDNLTRYLFINHQIAVREQHKLIYGHPAQYKDLPKRSNGATSTKESIVDSPEINQWMDTQYPRMDGKIRGSQEISTFKNVSYSDVNVVSMFYKDIAEGMFKSMVQDMGKQAAEARIGAKFKDDGTLVSVSLDSKGQPTGDLKAYLLLNEADAQAYILGDFYRDLLFLSAKLSQGQQRQINYEFAYERQQRSKNEKRDQVGYRPYTPQEIKDGLPDRDQEVVAFGNPGYVLPILKPQYFGYAKDANNMHTVFLKHSVKPLFYRFFEGTNFEGKYVEWQANQIDIVGYESGEKVGNVLNSQGEFDPYYNDAGAVSTTLPPIQELYTKYYGIQVEMAAKLKDEVIRGTQMTKIIMSNLFENGKPKKPEYQAKIDAYTETLVHIIRLGKQDLMRELGLQQLEDGSYITTDLKKLVTTLRDEAVKRDLPSNIVEAFEATLDTGATGLIYKFDSFSNRDKIDNILNSIVDSRVISQHMHGKPAVQAAVTGTEKLGTNRTIVYLKDGTYVTTNNFDSLSDSEKKTARIASSDLKFYHIKNGKTQSMEVLLPHWFKELYGKDQNLKVEDLDKRLLQLIGFRIPTQGMNSIDSIVVKGFLRPEEGDTIVVPSEIVGKAGSDFDIDKLNIYIPNYKIINGKPEYIEYRGEEDNNNKQALQNRLIEIMTDLLTLPDNYRQLVVPNGVDTLKAIEALILELRGVSKSKAIPFTQLSEWAYMSDIRERFLVGKQLVGIGALQITNQAITQVANIKLTGRLGEDAVVIRFPHNVSEDGSLYLSAITDKAGQWISELLSEALSGFVDAAKDPFVFELNINPATAGTYFYLMRLGVPVQSVALFHTQPIIMEYIRNQQNNESMLNKVNGEELSKSEIVALTQSDFVTKAFPGLIKDVQGNNTDLRTLYQKSLSDRGEPGPFGWEYPYKNAYRKAVKTINEQINGIANSIGEYKENDLKSNIRDGAKNNLSQGQSRYQLAVLSDFLRHQQEANALSNFINAVSYDTARTKNIIENVIQGFNFNKVVDQEFIEAPATVFDRTFLGEMRAQKQEVPKMFQNYFVSLHPNAQAIFQPMYRLVNDPNLSMTDDTKKEFLNRYQNFFLNYLLHTVRIINPLNNNEESLNKYYNLFFGMDSFAHQLKKAQIQFPNNKILSELFPIVSTDRTNTDNVKLFTSKLSTYESNAIIESAVNLLEQSEIDPNLRSFVNNLAVFSIIQSGVQISPISYTKVLPNELYARLVGTIFDKFTGSTSDISPSVVYKQFFQNNSSNGVLVPNAKLGYVRQDGIMTVPQYLRISGYDYLTKRTDKLNPVTNKPYSFAERQDLIKNKQWEDLFQRDLYEKYDQDENTSYYRPINKLGNRIFATEVYKTDTSTMTQDQIQLSGINGYVNEAANPTEAATSSRNAVEGTPKTNPSTSPSNISFIEHPEGSYRERTVVNAESDATIAVATNFDTPGEKLTKGSVERAKKKYISVDISTALDIRPEVEKIVSQLNSIKPTGPISLNIAGNGIYTLKDKYTQYQLDEYVYNLLRAVTTSPNLKVTIVSINTGGQTGIDEAGAKAGDRLGIPTTVRAPKGWIFRDITGKDISDERAFQDRFVIKPPTIGGNELNNTKKDLGC